MTLFSTRTVPTAMTDDAAWPWSELGLLARPGSADELPATSPWVSERAISARAPGGPVLEAHDWSLRSACLDEDPDLFFPVGETGRAMVQMEIARRICIECPVRRQCLELALRLGSEHGMWGGLNPAERKAIKRRYIKKYRHAQYW